MKVISFYLAFLIFVVSFLPYLLTSCISDDDKLQNPADIKVYNHTTDKITNIGIDDYIVGVVSAEMPASFSLEALKAQAVAARTYALYKSEKSLLEHKGANVCTDFSHCQAFVGENEAKNNWGTNFDEYYSKIKTAVTSTSMEVLTFEDSPAMTVFHSCSNGITEKASDVWSADLPYLLNVKSNDSIKKDYITTNEFTEDEFVSKISEFLKINIDNTKPAIGDVTVTDGGNTDTICIYGNIIKALDIRRIFNLKSTAFKLEKTADKFVFTVEGNGHGVGMSQYGAEAMAREGKAYTEILSHYYPSTKLTHLNKNDIN